MPPVRPSPALLPQLRPQLTALLLACTIAAAVVADESEVLRGALEAAQARRFDEAEVKFKHILEKHTSGAVASWAWPNLGGVYYAQQRWPEAEAAYRKAYELYHHEIKILDISNKPAEWQRSFNMVNTNLAASVKMQKRFVNHEVWGLTSLGKWVAHSKQWVDPSLC